MKKLTTLFLATIFVSVAFAQDKTNNTVDRKYPDLNNISVAKGGQTSPPIKKDRSEYDYRLLDKKILAALVVNEIPTDFPKSVKGMTGKEYKALLIAWYKENRSLVKPEYQAKFDEKIK